MVNGERQKLKSKGHHVVEDKELSRFLPWILCEPFLFHKRESCSKAKAGTPFEPLQMFEELQNKFCCAVLRALSDQDVILHS